MRRHIKRRAFLKGRMRGSGGYFRRIKGSQDWECFEWEYLNGGFFRVCVGGGEGGGGGWRAEFDNQIIGH